MCPRLTEHRFCKEHERVNNKQYEKYGRNYKTHKRYGRAWKRIRDAHVKTHPFCELCFAKHRVVKVEEVHHKLPISEGGTHVRENLMSLCKSCHSRLHAKRGDRWNR